MLEEVDKLSELLSLSRLVFGCAVLFVCMLQWHASLEHLSLCIHVCVYMDVQDCIFVVLVWFIFLPIVFGESVISVSE